jgi:hypothetical protein
MIDWWLVTSNAVWIVGAAILAWTWSYDRWLGHTDKFGLWLGFFLVCVGQALTGGRWWEVTGWILLAIWSAVNLWPFATFMHENVPRH